MPKQRADGEGEVAFFKGSKGPDTTYRARRRVTAPDGTKKRVVAYGRTKTIAIANREAEVKVFMAEHPSGGLLTVKQFAAKWLSHKQHSVTSSTMHDYAKTLRLHIIPHIGDKPFSTLSALEIQEAVSATAAQGKLNAADKARKVMKMLYKQAMRWQLVDRNPADMLEPVLRGPPKRGIWQQDETVRFLEVVKPSWYYPVYYMTLATGMRRGEVVSLRWSDIRGNSIYVERTYSQVGKDWVMGPPKTRESKRALPISLSLREMLNEHRQRLLDHQAKTKRNWRDNGLLFPSQTGELLYPPNLRLRLLDYAKKANVPAIRFHDLRRIYASNFIRSGGDPKQLQRRLGHATPDMAMAIYVSSFEGDNENVVFDLGELFRPTRRPTPDPQAENDPDMTLEEIDELLALDTEDDD
jgi:integrase